MELLAESGLANRLIIDCDATQRPEGLDEGAVAWLDGAAMRIAALPGVREARFRVLPENLVDNLDALTPALPQLIPPPEVTPERAEEIVRNALKQLMMPTPGALAMLRGDPFGLRAPLLLRLQALRQTTGLQFDDTRPFLCSKDGLHALIALELSVPYSDSRGARALLAQIHDILNADADAVPDLTYHLVGAHRHTIGNEDTIRRDLTLIGILSPLFLLALFLIVFRGDWRCIWIPLVPAAATTIVAGILATLNAPLQLFVLGLGGSILGLAVDQGIHLYIACRDEQPLQRLARLAKPLALGAGTSIAVFLLLAFTHSPALRQLGILAAGSLALSLLAAFLLLPTLLVKYSPNTAGENFAAQASGSPVPPKWAPFLALLAVGLVTALAFIPKLKTSFRIEELDGIPTEVRVDETAYQEAWLPTSPNLLLLRDPDDSQTPQLHAALAEQHPVSPQDFWPDCATRQIFLTAWREAPLGAWEELLDTAALKRGLPKGFFQPFFEQLRQGLTNPPTEPPTWFAAAYRQLRRNDISVFFLAEPSGVEELLDAENYDAAYLAPTALRNILTRDFGRQLQWLLVAATGMIIILALVTLRSWKKLLWALLPVLLTLRWLTAAFAICGHPITLMTAIGAVLLVGLAIDYGVFAVQWLEDGPNSSIPKAMLLSAATTVFTTGILLFSQHPVLFDLGLVLTPGIALAYLIARFFIPALSQLSFRTRSMGLLLLTSALLLAGCRTTYPSRPGLPPETAMAELQALHATTQPDQHLHAKITISFLWQQIPFLAAGQINHATRELHIVGLATSGGAKLFDITATPAEIRQATISPLAPPSAKRAFERVARDLACAMLDNAPEPPTSLTPDRRGVVRFISNGLQYTYAGEPLMLQRKASTHPRWTWRRKPGAPEIWQFLDRSAHLTLEVRFLN